MRKETREWLATHTIQDVREIATELENAGEDVDGLLEALDELERYVTGDGRVTRGKAKA